MSRTPRARVARRKEKTKKALLEVALGLFYEKGIYWTKIEDITERADVGKGTFYQYFQTKETLLQALLQQGLDGLLDRMTAALRTVDPGPHAISAIIRAGLDFYTDHPAYLLLFHQVKGLLQLKTGSVKELRAVYDDYLDRLAKLSGSALKGEPRYNGTVRELAMAISAFTSGLLTYHLLFTKLGQIKRQRERIQQQLEQSIQALL